MRNLLDNAIRHGRQGGEVRLSVAQGASRDGRPGIVIAVSDDGPGIARTHPPADGTLLPGGQGALSAARAGRGWGSPSSSTS